MIKDPYAADTPQDRTTRIAAWLCEQLAGAPEMIGGDKVIVMIHGADEHGGVAYDGYGDQGEAGQDMIAFVQAYFEARGASFRVVHMGGAPNRPDAS